jgi:hypothetical protein
LVEEIFIRNFVDKGQKMQGKAVLSVLQGGRRMLRLNAAIRRCKVWFACNPLDHKHAQGAHKAQQ